MNKRKRSGYASSESVASQSKNHSANENAQLQEYQDKYIFLDFDGVLHTLSDALRNEEFLHLNVLNLFIKNAIEKNPIRMNIVVSSSWRLSHTLEQLTKLLTHDLFGYENHIFKLVKNGLVKIDVTGNEIYSKVGFKQHMQNYGECNNRYLEIKKYIDDHKIQFGDYVVLDDSDGLFFIVQEDKTKKVQVKLDDGTYGYDKIVQPLISDAFGNQINPNYTNDDGIYVFDLFSKEQQEFNQSYVSTYKPHLRDGYLDNRGNLIDMNRILGLEF